MTKKEKDLAIFSGQEIRRIWDEEQEKWYFSVVDVVAVLTGSSIPKRYWSDLKNNLVNVEKSEVYDKIVQLKMLAEDNKMRETDVADTETIFRIIQSIPSPKAEPFKLWLARVGYERVEEVEDPEKAIQRAMATYLTTEPALPEKSWRNKPGVLLFLVINFYQTRKKN